ncbi:MAG: DUF2398 family protein [Bacilli bacterium]
MNIQKELDYLLKNYWVNKEIDRDMFYQIKSKIKEITEFSFNKLGNKIVVNSSIIKMEKIPNKINGSYSLKELDSLIDYILFMFVLMYLEDKVRNDQFILSNLVSYITDNSGIIEQKNKPNWDLYSHRKSLIKVLKYATTNGLIKVVDDNNLKFTETMESEVLYENLGTSYHFIKRFKEGILDYMNYEDFLNDDIDDITKQQNLRKHYIYKELLYSPVVYFKDEEISKIDYLRNYRSYIENDFSDKFNANLLIFKNMATLSYETSNNPIDFPNSKAITDILMFINYSLTHTHEPNKDDDIILLISEFKLFLADLKEKNDILFSKEYRQMSTEKLYLELIEVYKNYNLVELEDNVIKFRPAITLLTGKYDYEEEENNFSQIELLLED